MRNRAEAVRQFFMSGADYLIFTDADDWDENEFYAEMESYAALRMNVETYDDYFV